MGSHKFLAAESGTGVAVTDSCSLLSKIPLRFFKRKALHLYQINFSMTKYYVNNVIISTAMISPLSVYHGVTVENSFFCLKLLLVTAEEKSTLD